MTRIIRGVIGFVTTISLSGFAASALAQNPLGDIPAGDEGMVTGPEKGDSVDVEAVLTYQTCDNEICYPPDEFALTFQFDILEHDRQNAPDDIRHQ